MTSPLVGRVEQPKPTPPKSRASAYSHEGCRRKQGEPPQFHKKQHASRAPICLNLKEICRPAQVAGARRFDLRETPIYLKVKMTG
jgi:hypothetical protein